MPPPHRIGPDFKRTAALWALPLLLWIVATGWYAFDLGKYSDDWAISLRTPETDTYEWPASPFMRWNYFWRPLHLLTVYGLATVFWHHDWINHAISALAHLGVAVLAYRLLRAVGVGRAAAVCALSVFIAIPMSIEAVLWPAALGSVVGVGWFLLIALMCVRIARVPAGEGWLESTRTWAALALMGFLTACWHEQPAACVLALPLLFLAVTPKIQRKAVLGRVLRAGTACGAGVGAYIALFAATVPPGRRGGTDTLVGLDAIGDRLIAVGGGLWKLSMGPRARNTTLDAWEIGWTTISGAPLGIAFVVLAVGLAIVWAAWTSRVSNRVESAEHSAKEPGAHRGWLTLFGVGMAIASLMPIALVVWQPMQSRYLYGAGAGLAIALAAVLDGVWMRIHSTRVRGTCMAACGLLAAGVGLAGAICCVGMQSQFRGRYIADVDQLGQLLRLAPNPPPNAVFVPVVVLDARLPGLRAADPGIRGPIAYPWSCWAYIQQGYGRSDLSATNLRGGPRMPISIDERGVTYPRGLCDRWGRENPARTFTPWENVVAFSVDAAGVVHLLSPQEAIRAARGNAGDEQ